MKSTHLLLIATITLTLLAAPAGATLVNTYSDRTVWTAAAGGVVSTIDFNGLAPTDYSTALGLTQSGVNFVGFTGVPGEYNLHAQSPVAPWGNWLSGDYLVGGYTGANLTATLPGSGSLAVGFDLMTYPQAKVVQVHFSTGETVNISTAALSTRTFYGVVSDTPITSVNFSTQGNGYTLLDNFSFAEATGGEVPEANSALLGGLGLVVLLLARRRRRSA